MTARMLTLLLCLSSLALRAAGYDNADTIVVARDGSGHFATIGEALEACRAFMDYHKVIYVRKGIYREKVVVPQWLQNIEICGEERDQTVIVYADHANIQTTAYPKGMGTFRTYTLKVEGSDITLKNITIENDAPRLGQAVALHTEGDRLRVLNCRLLGHQDTVYTGMPHTRLLFDHCYIEGTTDFIFGPATAWFEQCTIHCLQNSYITAAATPRDALFGYVFHRCTITAADGVGRLYLGRPWRDYGHTLFMHCTLPAAIRPEGWYHWEQHREQTARYAEYGNTGPGADTSRRAPWSRQLGKEEAEAVTPERVFGRSDQWTPLSSDPRNE